MSDLSQLIRIYRHEIDEVETFASLIYGEFKQFDLRRNC